jgi:hypothetical protein
MIKKFLYLFLLISSPSIVALDTLQKGVAVTDANIDELATTSWEYAKSSTTQEKFSDGFADAFFMQTGTTNLYSLSGKPAIYLTNFDTREVLGNWPLNPWPAHLFLEGENSSAVKTIAAVHDEAHLETGDLLTVLNDSTAYYHLNNLSDLTFKTGCLQQSPLRYGDIESDGENELVLMLRKNIVVFSPKHEKIIFSAHYWLDDELGTEDVSNHFSGEISETKAQYVASSGTDNLVREIYPAKRSMSKLYLGDFDNNGKNDIVIWRKMYESNLRNNPTIGFHKLAESSFHYERDTSGQYQLQTDTAPETVQGWLTANNQTWQSGFPSKSECAGQEGQLIPEMHDPLLNDPDVLK